MFDFIPKPVAAVLGCGLMVFLLIYGLFLTSKKSSPKSSDTKSDAKKE